tara:strand:+ start:1782 stop:2018 length:237 start_codon:yes stop_codon:yes gene_type:complete
MSQDWRDILTIDGMPKSSQRIVYEILKYNPKIKFNGLKGSLSKKKRVSDRVLKEFLRNATWIKTTKHTDGTKLYQLRE